MICLRRKFFAKKAEITCAAGFGIGFVVCHISSSDLGWFSLSVDYRAPSKEIVFLAEGWGIRDVRGPYITRDKAFLRISEEFLSATVPSTLRLSLELSNRCSTEGLVVRFEGIFGNRGLLLARNKSADIIFENVLAKFGCYELAIYVPQCLASEAMFLQDVVALNSLSLQRWSVRVG